MKNITVSVEEDAHRWARVRAAELDTSLSSVVREFLIQFAGGATRASGSDPLTHEQATSLIESWLRFRVQETTIDLLRNALSSKERWNPSYWDAAVVEGARLAGCRVLLTEDLQHGADFAGVRVENPFR